MSAVRVVVDYELCQGHAECTVEAPGVFALADSGQVRVLEDRPPADRHEAVRAAVRYCPTHALRLEED